MSKHRGFTLIELLIVVAVMGILLVAVVPSGSYWVENAKMANAQGNLDNALGRAKSAALRNQHLSVGQEPVVAVCIDSERTVSVFERTATATPVCPTASATAGVGTKLWSASVDSAVSVKSGTTDVSCICLNNLGMVTTNACTSCTSLTTISLEINDLSETLYIY